jgi:phage terminase small subunit
MMPKSDGRALTPKQEAFCLAYIQTGNASEAYRRSYDATKMKDKTVWEKASVLLSDGKVSARVKELRASVTEIGIMSAQEALEEATRLARFDIRKLYRPDGSPIPIQDLDEDTARCVAAVDIHEEYAGSGKDRVFVGYTKKYKTHEKNAALEKLFRHHGLYERDHRQASGFLHGLPAETVRQILDKLREIKAARESQVQLVG